MFRSFNISNLPYAAETWPLLPLCLRRRLQIRFPLPLPAVGLTSTTVLFTLLFPARAGSVVDYQGWVLLLQATKRPLL